MSENSVVFVDPAALSFISEPSQFSSCGGFKYGLLFGQVEVAESARGTDYGVTINGELKAFIAHFAPVYEAAMFDEKGWIIFDRLQTLRTKVRAALCPDDSASNPIELIGWFKVCYETGDEDEGLYTRDINVQGAISALMSNPNMPIIFAKLLKVPVIGKHQSLDLKTGVLTGGTGQFIPIQTECHLFSIPKSSGEKSAGSVSMFPSQLPRELLRSSHTFLNPSELLADVRKKILSGGETVMLTSERWHSLQQSIGKQDDVEENNERLEFEFDESCVFLSQSRRGKSFSKVADRNVTLD